MSKKKSWLEVESHTQAIKATISCNQHDRGSGRVACVECMEPAIHNLALDFARRAIKRYHETAIERGLSEHPDDLAKYIDRAIDSALEDDE